MEKKNSEKKVEVHEKKKTQKRFRSIYILLVIVIVVVGFFHQGFSIGYGFCPQQFRLLLAPRLIHKNG